MIFLKAAPRSMKFLNLSKEALELVEGGAGRGQDHHVAGLGGPVGGQHRLGEVVNDGDGQRLGAVIRGGFHRGADFLGGIACEE